jgi:hypothetical protein
MRSSNTLAGSVMLAPEALRSTSAGRGCRHPRRLLAFARGGAYDRSGGSGSRTGGGWSLSRIAVRVRMRGENGYRSGDGFEMLFDDGEVGSSLIGLAQC